jgi:6-pyruvoyltetrahydropterin/6-carboxytetrahydropterin synthase
MIEIFKKFSFDAAHHLAPNVAAGHPYARMHGHSFSVTVTLRGELDLKRGWLVNFEDLDKALNRIHGELDHHFLNDIKGLELPTLENITRWIWANLKPDLPLLYRITVNRGTLGEGCSYAEES